MRWGYFGTDEFSRSVLERLLNKGEKPRLVITTPDKPRGRGRNLKPTPVKSAALEAGVDVLTPEKLTKGVCEKLKSLCDFFLLCSYGKILPSHLLKDREVYNLHPSLLPKYRGAAPIRYALFNGDTSTGVTIIRTVKELDAGEVWKQESLRISPEDDFSSLSGRLAELGSELLLDLLKTLREKGELRFKPQVGEPSYAPKLRKEDLKIDWESPPETIVNRIRGLSKTPGAFSYLNGTKVKLLTPCKTIISATSGAPGEIERIEKGGAWVVAKGGYVVVEVLQLPCKKPTRVWDLLQGRKLRTGMRFS